MTSGQETERVHSYKPGARTGPATHDRAILGMKACRDMDMLYVNENNICIVRNEQETATDAQAADSARRR